MRGGGGGANSFLPVARFCSHESQILVKIRATGRTFLKVPLRINFVVQILMGFFDFNVPFQVTIRGTKTSLGTGKNFGGREMPL